MAGQSKSGMAELEALYERFRETTPPQGVISTVEDVYEAIDEYDGFVSGLAQTVLAGEAPSVSRIDPGDDLDGRLREAEAKMAALRAHLEKLRELAMALRAVRGQAD